MLAMDRPRPTATPRGQVAIGLTIKADFGPRSTENSCQGSVPLYRNLGQSCALEFVRGSDCRLGRRIEACLRSRLIKVREQAI
jgi:hypothetical protein